VRVRRGARPARRRSGARPSRGIRTLSIDIGGSHIKAMVLDAAGRPVSGRVRMRTPDPSTPMAVMRVIHALTRELARFDRVSVGFPGVVESGLVRTAANLHPRWRGVNVQRLLRQALRRPVRVANDADVQGLGVVKGRGTELVITLGTGMGSALFVDGRLVPNLEFGHHPFRNGKTYEELIGERPLLRVGRRRWRRRVGAAIETLRHAFNPRTIYVGGGNARLLRSVPEGVKVVSNVSGILGGIRLWEDAAPRATRRRAVRSRSR
jgi:polyphosphate glucokinase